ncbi:hypothetical protein M8J77_010155 [Diaphorina citri]|nr:hypothetical protein M8J77_010155 [Diaphorina citri]
MFRYALYLSGFDYEIEYKRTEHHANADYLSRFPVDPVSNVNAQDESCQFQLNQLNTIATENITPRLIASNTEKDTDLKPILDYLTEGKSLEALGLNDCEFSLQDGCIFKGRRVVIPCSLQKDILRELHVGHLGIVKMKALARCFCYWKNIDTHIEQFIKSCRACCMKQNEPPKETSHPWEMSSQPWERIHIDFAGPESGWYYFIVVDSFTKWVEVIPTKTTTADWCIRQLRNLFCTFGIPTMLVSDNGSQFKSSVFESFLVSNGVCHRTSAPYHPATNGQAERFVQTIKKSLKCMQDERGDINLKLNRLLMQLRKVPNDNGDSSYTLMFGRNIRTRLDTMMRMEHKLDNDNCSSRFKPRRSFDVGSRVQARNYTTLFVEGSNQDDLIGRGEIVLAQAQVWFNANRLHLNQSKTQHIVISLSTANTFENPDSVDLLGFRIDPQLKWHAHIDKVAKKVSSRIFLLRRLQSQVSREALKNAYYGLVHSILTYGILLWGHSTSVPQLFILQKKAVRIVSGAQYLEHAKPLFIQLGILTLPSLFILQCLLHTKKNIAEFPNFEAAHSYDTRNKNNLVPFHHRVYAARNGTNYHGISFYNKLPLSIRDLPLPSFKRFIENYLKSKAFYSTEEFLLTDSDSICLPTDI